METIQPIKIPQSHIDFANDVAELADKNGMESFVLEFDPMNDTNFIWDRRTRGTVKMVFSTKDTRGRPSRNLSISFDAKITHTIHSEPNSHD